MPPPVNATGAKLYGALGASVNYTGITVAAGSNRALVVQLAFDANASPGTVTCVWDSGGSNQLMASIVDSSGNGNAAGTVYLFGLVNPAVGNLTLSVSWTGNLRVFVDAICWNGIDQTGGTTTFYNAVTGASVSTVSVASAASDAVVAVESSSVSQGTSTGTLLFDDHVSATVINAMAQYDAGAASVAIGNTGTNNHIVACGVKAAAGAAPTYQPKSKNAVFLEEDESYAGASDAICVGFRKKFDPYPMRRRYAA